jgi:uncharacterized protein YbbC (DUF1343 family)
MTLQTIQTGLDVIKQDSFSLLSKKRIAVLANQASVDSELNHLIELLLANQSRFGFELKKIFAPEHGFGGIMQDMDKIGDENNSGIKVISLYGNSEDSLTPTTEMLKDIEVLLVDLPDIGTRYYTFAQTMTYCMQIAAKTGTLVVVLDRPNPIGGVQIEGVGLDSNCRSFCGYAATPQRHGLTLGELATLVNKGFGKQPQEVPAISCNLQIIKAKNWRRDDYFDKTSLPWIAPSVNMPTLDTAIVYPGMCLFEATNISEGRGTTKPFEYAGAPYINGKEWAEATLKEEIPLEGAKLRPIEFMPKFQKHKDARCGGIQLHITDRNSFSSFKWAIALLSAASRLYPNHFAWRDQAYEFISKVPAIDLLYGSDSLRKTIKEGKSLQLINSEIEEYQAWFTKERQQYLIYS